MKKLLNAGICLSVLFSLAGAAHAATIGQKAGTTAGEFLMLAPGAKPAAMGEAYSGLADDIYSLYFNAAGLAKIKEQQVLFSHTGYYMDVNHEYVAYARPWKGGGIGASITYLMTTFEKRAGDTDSPDSNGRIGDMAVTMGYGRSLAWGIDGGFTLKYISSTLDTYSASSLAFDAGLQKAVTDKITAGCAVSNVGGALKYINESVAIGNLVDIGLGSRNLCVKNLSLAIDYKMLLNASNNSINCGAQYLWNITREWGIAPRAGFISNNATVTAGVGINYKGYQFDYALDSQSDLGMSNRISLGMKF
jgi:hypothetical protein